MRACLGCQQPLSVAWHEQCIQTLNMDACLGSGLDRRVWGDSDAHGPSGIVVVVPVYAERESQIRFLLQTVEQLKSLDPSPRQIILVDDSGPCVIPAEWRSKHQVCRVKLHAPCS